MNDKMRSCFKALNSKDRNEQFEAYSQIIEAIKEKVDWAYEVWDQLKEDLTSANNHKRSRAAQFLSHLAYSDPDKRIIDDFPRVWEVTKDHKFVTARHSLQAIWRIGLAGDEQKKMVIEALVERFLTCDNEKNDTLIRFDIIQGLRNLYDELKEEEIKQLALDLIEKEEDSKYKKKYVTVWKKV